MNINIIYDLDTPRGYITIASRLVDGIIRLWGKTDPFHPLLWHMIDAGCVAEALFSGNGTLRGAFDVLVGASGVPENMAPGIIAFLVANHDIGKCHADFQHMGGDALVRPLVDAGFPFRPAGRDATFVHYAWGAAWFRDYLVDVKGWSVKVANVIMGAIDGHHGVFGRTAPHEASLLKERWDPVRQEIVRLLSRAFNVPDAWCPPARFSNASVAGALLCGFTVLADWIASNETLMPQGLENHHAVKSVDEYIVVTRQNAARAVESLGFITRHSWHAFNSFKEAFPDYDPNSIQQACEALGNHPPAITGSVAAESTSRHDPALLIIEAPMGDGKTEAALYTAGRWLSASRARGLYVALPTGATSNQMHERVVRFVARHQGIPKEQVKLVHGMAWLLDEHVPAPSSRVVHDGKNGNSEAEAHDPGLAHDWFRPRKRALLAAHAVGTVDQAMLGILRSKFFILRLLGIAGKVLIIDEIHAYDAYMSRIIDRLVQWCSALGVPVILLSATLTTARRQEILRAYRATGAAHVASSAVSASPGHAGNTSTIPSSSIGRNIGSDVATCPYPLLTVASREGIVEEIPVHGSIATRVVHLQMHENVLGDAPAIAKLAKACSDKGKCVAVITNTVASAQEIYAEVCKLLPRAKKIQDAATFAEDDTVIGLFHARFPAGLRQVIERSVLSLFDKRSLKGKDGKATMSRPARSILVATQVIEQSLDIDFDEMISEIAPVDLLLQRAGRLHRHSRPGRVEPGMARLHVLLPRFPARDFGTSCRVYSPHVLMRTCLEIVPRASITLPDAMRPLIEGVYGTDPVADPSQIRHDGRLVVDVSVLRETRDLLDQQIKNDRDKPGPYLVPEPASNVFKMAQVSQTAYADEDDAPELGHLIAKTRLEKYRQIRIILLQDSSFDAALTSKESPPAHVVRDILSNFVTLPAWWFSKVTPAAGHDPLDAGPRWLRGYFMLRLHGGRWEGIHEDGTPRSVVLDAERGVYLVRESESEAIMDQRDGE